MNLERDYDINLLSPGLRGADRRSPAAVKRLVLIGYLPDCTWLDRDLGLYALGSEPKRRRSLTCKTNWLSSWWKNRDWYGRKH